MTADAGYVEATCYLQVEPEWFYGGREPIVNGARVVRLTQRRPTNDGRPMPAPSTVIIKLTVRVPRSAYAVPALTVELPGGPPAVSATAESAEGGTAALSRRTRC